MKELTHWLLDNDYEFSNTRNIHNKRQIIVYGKYTKKPNSHDYTMNLDHLKLLMYLDDNYFERFNVNIDMDNQRIIITELEINDDSLFTDEELKVLKINDEYVPLLNNLKNAIAELDNFLWQGKFNELKNFNDLTDRLFEFCYPFDKCFHDQAELIYAWIDELSKALDTLV